MSRPDRNVVIDALAAAGAQLPPQPPLARFIHFISLQGDLALPFPEAVRRARERRGVHGWPAASTVREAIASGRLTPEDVRGALCDVLGPEVALPVVHGTLSPVLLQDVLAIALEHTLTPITPTTLRDRLLEGATERVAPEVSSDAGRRLLRGRPAPRVLAELWTTLLRLTHAALGDPRALPGELEGSGVPQDAWKFTPPANPSAAATVAGGWARYLPGDLDQEVTASLTPWLARFADEGVAAWRSATRSEGFWPWLQQVALAGTVVSDLPANPVEAIVALLDRLGVPVNEAATAIEREVMALQGWSAMAAWYGARPADASQTDRPLSLGHIVAARLALTAVALAKAAPTLGLAPSRADLDRALTDSPHAFALREAAFGGALDDDLMARVRTLHEARTAISDPVWRRLALGASWRQGSRHHGERLRAGSVTWPLFRLAQHLGLDADAILGLGSVGVGALHHALQRFDVDAAGAVALEALERVERELIGHGLAAHRGSLPATPPASSQIIHCIDDREESLRRHLEELDPSIETYAAAGFFLVPMLYKGLDDTTTTARCPVVIAPKHLVIEEVRPGAQRAKATLAERALRILGVAAPARVPTRLAYTAPHPLEDASTANPQAGFTDAEQIDIVATSLVAWGLLKPAPLVVVMGHTSSSTNNPYDMSYGCGACAGNPGGTNGRLLAAMANRPAVRRALLDRGLEIPPTTWFLGAQHDTAADAVTWFDLEDLPPTHEAAFASLDATVRRACARSAHERIRRLPLAPVDASEDEAQRHVQRRAIDPRQPRPELGHTGNALAIIGRRTLPRGLFLDRRAFLVSYDATVDPDGSVLEATLMASGPVGAQISLDYYFSATDREHLGGGTKAGQNLVAGLGVLQGAEGDLRTGLPWQMIEQHEPIRLLLFVEATLEHLGQVHGRREVIRNLLDGAWVHLVAIDPTTGAMHRFVPGTGFVAWTPPERPLPQRASSKDWYVGQTGYLGPARIVPVGGEDAA